MPDSLSLTILVLIYPLLKILSVAEYLKILIKSQLAAIVEIYFDRISISLKLITLFSVAIL